MPKFVWVAEVREPNVEDTNEIKCEIVIDSTASKHDYRSYIVVRYPSGVFINKRWETIGNAPNIVYIPAEQELLRTPFPGNLRNC